MASVSDRSSVSIKVTVDGVRYADQVEPRTLLVHYLRENIGKVGTVVGCDTSNCGACTVLMAGPDGSPVAVKSCSVLAVQADGADVTTVEGLAEPDGTLHPLQRAFHEQHGLQCGFCTPGMIMCAVDLLRENPHPTEEEIREGISGNLCRCTGYQNIINAISSVADGPPREDTASFDMTAADVPTCPVGGGVVTTSLNEPVREIGRARLRKEDARLITGHTRWTENIALPGMVHMAILRSPYAHARITAVDTSAALGQPNVIAAYSGADIADTQGVLACAWPVTEDIVSPTYLPLAVDEVRHVGEPVAVVIARDRVSAIDALESIEVSYEPLPVVLDMEEALAEGSPLVHADAGTNKSYTWIFDSAAAGSGGDVAEADREVEITRRYVQQRLIPSFMEPRSVIVDPGDGEWTVYSATQIPHIVRFLLAATTGTPEHKIRVIAPDVGGGFGGKLAVTPEEWITFAVATKVGRAVKYTESRAESLVSAHHGRDVIQDITLTARRDGTVTGLSVKLIANMGAYLGIVTPGVPILGAFMYNSIYKFPAYRFECTGVFTNTTKTDAYRGAGRPEATYAIERIMDELAAELELDPMEIRRRNWINHAEFPFSTVAGLVYDSGNYEAATDKAMALMGYDDLRAEQAARRVSNDPIQLGIGISTYTEMCGLAPSRVLGALRYGAGGWESVSVRVLPTGKVEVISGSTPHGQGHATAWSQIVADQLGVPFEDVSVLYGDTRVSPKGMDTYGSRSLAVGGVAMVMACEKVRDKAKVIAAHMLECSADDLEFTEGAFRVRGNPEAAKTLADVAIAVFAAHDLPDGVEPQLDSEATFDPSTFSFPHGTHLCAAEVDTETGRVKIRRYVAVDDVGTVINPLIVEGQVHGGVAQGIAQALFEEAVYDESGNLITGSFAEYLLPSAADLPRFVTDRTETPATSHPLGTKGVGEAGTIASTPAVVNAIVDALRPKGVIDVPMPCTPERVWRAANGTAASAGSGPADTSVGASIGHSEVSA